MSERRMDAYYFEFDPTGNNAVDKILGAVACAGKAYHHTESWCDDTFPYDDHSGSCPVDWIQNAATEADASFATLSAQLAEVLEAVRREESFLRECISGISPKRQAQIEAGDYSATLAEHVFSALHRLSAAIAKVEGGE